MILTRPSLKSLVAVNIRIKANVLTHPCKSHTTKVTPFSSTCPQPSMFSQLTASSLLHKHTKPHLRTLAVFSLHRPLTENRLLGSGFFFSPQKGFPLLPIKKWYFPSHNSLVFFLGFLLLCHIHHHQMNCELAYSVSSSVKIKAKNLIRQGQFLELVFRPWT